jgi:hypothetical protein
VSPDGAAIAARRLAKVPPARVGAGEPWRESSAVWKRKISSFPVHKSFITSLVGHLPPFIALFIAYGTNRGGSIHNLDNPRWFFGVFPRCVLLLLFALTSLGQQYLDAIVDVGGMEDIAVNEMDDIHKCRFTRGGRG